MRFRQKECTDVFGRGQAGQVLHKLGESPVAFAQRFFGKFALCDVDDGAEHSHRASALTQNRGIRVEPGNFAIRPDRAELYFIPLIVLHRLLDG